jgi:hypothetical protein
MMGTGSSLGGKALPNVRNVLLITGASNDLVLSAAALGGATGTASLSFATVVPEPEALEADRLRDWRQQAWGTPEPPKDPETWGDPAYGELGCRFVTAVAPPEVWLEAIARRFPSLAFDLIYQAVDGAYAGRTARRRGELASYDWLDPELDYDLPRELAAPAETLSGSLTLDDVTSYADPIAFTIEQLDEWGRGLTLPSDRALFAFSLWLFDLGDLETGDDWTHYYGPLTDWAIRDVGAELRTWVESTMARALEIAAWQGPERALDTVLETRVLVEVFPTTVEGWYRIPPVG